MAESHAETVGRVMAHSPAETQSREEADAAAVLAYFARSPQKASISPESRHSYLLELVDNPQGVKGICPA